MRLSLLAAAALCVSSLAAHADTFQLFNINGQLSNGASVTGTINIDLTDVSKADEADLTYTLGSNSYTATGTQQLTGSSLSQPSFVVLQYLDGSSTTLFDIAFPASSGYNLNGYTGGDLCSTLNPCISDPSEVTLDLLTKEQTTLDLVSGTATLAATPEPSSIALLGTGLIGVAGVVRKRFA